MIDNHRLFESTFNDKPIFKRSGFSLLEVVVALVVVSTLSLIYIGMQRESIGYLEDIDSRMEHVNFAQSYLVEHPFFAEHTPTPDWIGTEDDKKWRIEINQDEEILFVTLKTLYKEGSMTWDWVSK